MSESQEVKPQPVEQQPEEHEEEHAEQVDAAEADGAAVQASESPVESSEFNPLQTELQAADQPEDNNPDTDNASSRLSPENDDTADLTSQAVDDMELQQDAEGEEAETSSHSPADSSPQQEVLDDSQQDNADVQAAADGPTAAAHWRTSTNDVPAGTSVDSYAAAPAGYLPGLLEANDLPRGAASGLSPAAETGTSEAYTVALSNPELDPDHPLLARAQDALGKQLLAIKYRLESDVREKSVALQVLSCCGAHRTYASMFIGNIYAVRTAHHAGIVVVPAAS